MTEELKPLNPKPRTFVQMRRVPRPPLWKYLLDRFVTADGKFIGKFLPTEPYWRAPIKKLRSSGWMRRTNFGLAGANEKRISDTVHFMWTLTDRGKIEAEKAVADIKKYNDDVAAAVKEWREANGWMNDQ